MTAAALVLLLLPLQEKKEEKDPKPRCIVAVPLAVPPGKTTKIAIRGLNLDAATEVKLAEAVDGVEIALKGKGKADLPNNVEPETIGNTKVDLEIKVPEHATGPFAIVVTNEKGRSPPYLLAVSGAVAEKEPNGGFSQAQKVDAGTTVIGTFPGQNDVDVFRIDGKAGETWVFEVEAQRRGSPVDAHLTVHDAKSLVVAANDDLKEGRDARVEVKLAADGSYTLTLMDANNGGGPAHGYLLHVRRGP